MILTSGMLCVTMPQGKTLPVYLTMWAIILASVVAVFRVRDMPMDFELLAQSPGPGMGLVVYRQDMCRIIRALVAGEDLTSTDDIPRFKASAFRMQVGLSSRLLDIMQLPHQLRHMHLYTAPMNSACICRGSDPPMHVHVHIRTQHETMCSLKQLLPSRALKDPTI